jgi:hypothetical protein
MPDSERLHRFPVGRKQRHKAANMPLAYLDTIGG